MKYLLISLWLILILSSCNNKKQVAGKIENKTDLMVLGIAQDAGYPQINCEKECCNAYWRGERKAELVTSLGLIDRADKKAFLVEASPDIVRQWQNLKSECTECEIEGILLTHAHIGHYSGLIYLGREAMGAKKIKVYAMPKMAAFLKSNGPWSQLVTLENIELLEMKNDRPFSLSKNIQIKPSIVPHRDEFSETVGFTFTGAEKSILFIPDIDKWDTWEKDIIKEISKVDIAFLDGTFFDGKELPGRDMSLIPHPFISESIGTFSHLKESEIDKIWFIHFNHTNSVMLKNSANRSIAENLGFNFAFERQTISF